MNKVQRQEETTVILEVGKAKISMYPSGDILLSISGDYAGMIVKKTNLGDFIMVVQALAEELAK